MHKALWPAAVSVVLHGVLLAAYVACFQGDLSVLVCVGSDRLGQPPYELVTRGMGKYGYDGQFYYALARSPWQRQERGFDSAPARQVRILYPAVSWLLSGGDARLLFWVMPLVNLLAIGGLGWLGARVASYYGLNPWWGCLLPLAVNAGLPALRNLTDDLSAFTVCGLLAAHLRRQPWWALALWGGAAVFTRETNVVVLLAVLGVVAWNRHGMAAAGLGAVLLGWSAWVIALRMTYGEWPFLPSGGNLATPFAGPAFGWSHLHLSHFRLSKIVPVLRLAGVFVPIGLAFYLVVRFKVDRAVLLVAAAGAALALTGGTALYEDYWSYTRVFAWLPLTAWLGCVQARRCWALAVLTLPFVVPLSEVKSAWRHPISTIRQHSAAAFPTDAPARPAPGS
jgi:hypothetical protein